MTAVDEIGTAVDDRAPAAVTMYVFNDATLDSRVRREAATLAAAGLDVRLMAIPRRAAPPGIERERVDGYEIVRVPVPSQWREGWRSVVAPWTLRRRSIGRLKRSLVGGPRGWADVPRAVGAIATAVGLSGIRRTYIAIATIGRSDAPAWPPENLYWLAWWRGSVLGWCRDAADHARPAAVHHGHDLTALSAAVRGAKRDGSRSIYDSHEIYPDSAANAERPLWARALLRWRERQWTRRIDALVSVNPAYARVIANRIRPKRTVIVHNCPPRWVPRGDERSKLESAAAIPPGVPILLYHGAFSRHRGLEQLAEAALEPRLARAHVIFLGYGGQRSMLDALAAQPRFGGRLHVLDAVPPDDLLSMVAGADVDVIPLQRSSLNHWLCTPNKLFESIAAGVPVVVSDFPQMRRIVEGPDGPLGSVCQPDDRASIARACGAILEMPASEREDLRDRCRRAAAGRWNWETESVRLLELYDDLTRDDAD
ncbi:MAG TPA: glycosyltransferase [Candidatus Limnocylindrales bacterium]|nr:glycosyltransferase [Candidatus Limnocylindrales bacterium]